MVAGLGVPAATIAWIWYGLVQFEAQTEQSKAVSARTTMAGVAEVWGGFPLVIAHVVGLVTLVPRRSAAVAPRVYTDADRLLNAASTASTPQAAAGRSTRVHDLDSRTTPAHHQRLSAA